MVKSKVPFFNALNSFSMEKHRKFMSYLFIPQEVLLFSHSFIQSSQVESSPSTVVSLFEFVWPKANNEESQASLLIVRLRRFFLPLCPYERTFDNG